MKKRTLVSVAVALLVVSGIAILLRPDRRAAEPSGRPLPASMAAIGDSITQAVAVNSEALVGAPEHSWATGTEAGDPVDSHAERLRAAGALQGSVFNNSVPGATVADAIEQAATTVEQKVDYVVILVGGNDVCAPSTDAVTTPQAFAADARATLETLATGLPEAAVYVVSIPNVYRLWEIGSEEALTQQLWDGLGVCSSVLSSRATEADRRTALERNESFNAIWERTCIAYPNCRYDGGIVFDLSFEAEHIGPLDRFHPSIEGQALLADVSWSQGFWPEI